MMFLKKDFFSLPFSKVKYYNMKYDSVEDLRNGIVEMVSLLNTEKFMIEVFHGDEINCFLQKYYKSNILRLGNFNYYEFEILDFLREINFETLRFMTIYLIDDMMFETNNLKQIIKESKFTMMFDNYLEVTSIKVDLNKLDYNIIKKFLC